MTDEIWLPIAGYEGRYEVSDLGNVRSVDVLVPYNHWRSGARLERLKRGKPLPQQRTNAGYLIVHLNLDNARAARTVHRLVAETFEPFADFALDVNHKDGVKINNRWDNLEWINRSGNHDHAVDLGLNKQALAVICPRTGARYPSINRAAQDTGRAAKTIREQWGRA